MFAPFYQMLIWDFDAAVPSIIAMSLLLVWRHSANIGKLPDRKPDRRQGARAAGRSVRRAGCAAPGTSTSHDAAHAERKRARQRQPGQDGSEVMSLSEGCAGFTSATG